MTFTIKTLLRSIQFVQASLHGTCTDEIAGVELHAKVWSRQREERVEFVAVLEELWVCHCVANDYIPKRVTNKTELKKNFKYVELNVVM